MQQPSNKEQNEYDPSTENELKKIKLALEHGMDLSKSFTSPDLPPEIEGQFLDNIKMWEEQYAQRKITTVYEIIGKPSFTPVNEIADDDISTSLSEAMELLNQHSIDLDTLCDVDERELYRFITEEFIKVETDDIRVEGMIRCFTYEDYYPNHPYDIKNRCTELIEHIARTDIADKLIPWGLADHVTNGGRLFTKEELHKHIINFRVLFTSLTLDECNYLSVSLNDAENEATAIAYVQYTGISESGETVTLSGECTFKLTYVYDWWTIHQFETPWQIIV